MIFRLIRIIFIILKYKGLFLISNLQILPLPSYFQPSTSQEKGKRLRIILEKLGPFFVKFGQTLATRSDILGDEISNELSLLQDKMTPKMSRESAALLIKTHFKKDIKDIFKEFSNTPIAAASISEIFTATTIEGKKVAVKILKPKIEKLLNRDIKLFFFIAKIIDKRFSSMKRLQLSEVVKLFEKTTKIELDLTLEAAAASELSENQKKDKGIYIPKIYWEYTSKNILTIEWLEGIPINQIQSLKKHKININKTITNFAFMFFNQAYRDGFFHADLHPGNVLVKKDSTIELLDFGIMGRLDSKTRIYLAEILKGFINRDYYHIAKVHFAAGYVTKNHSIEEFAQGCRAIGEPIVGMPSNKISVGILLSRLFKLTKDFDMKLQPQLLLVQKTTIVVEGVISSLDPSSNMWEIAKPWIEKWEEQSFDAKLFNKIQDVYSFIKDDFIEFFKRNKDN